MIHLYNILIRTTHTREYKLNKLCGAHKDNLLRVAITFDFQMTSKAFFAMLRFPNWRCVRACVYAVGCRIPIPLYYIQSPNICTAFLPIFSVYGVTQFVSFPFRNVVVQCKPQKEKAARERGKRNHYSLLLFGVCKVLSVQAIITSYALP